MKAAWFVMVLLIAACSAAEMPQSLDSENSAGLPPTDLERIQEGIPAPDFTLESVDGNSVTLSEYRGEKNVVLVFYRGYW